jgi:hypothetical protein
MLKLRRQGRVLSPEAGQLITREDVSRRELALWRMFDELPAQPSRCHHAAGEVRVLAKSLTSTPRPAARLLPEQTRNLQSC